MKRKQPPGTFIEVGEVGLVIEWGCYGCSVWVRVEFGGVRANFYPCEIEEVAR